MYKYMYILNQYGLCLSLNYFRLYMEGLMCFEQIIRWIISQKRQILWKASFIFSDRNTFFFL